MFRYITLLLTVSVQAFSQSPESLKIRDYRNKNEQPIINEFISFLSIPNVAADTSNIKKMQHSLWI